MIKQTAIALFALILCLPAHSETLAKTAVSNNISGTEKDITKTSEQFTLALKSSSEVLSENSQKPASNIVKHIDFTKQDPLAAVDYGDASPNLNTLLASEQPSAVSSNRAIVRATKYTVRGKTYRTLASAEGFEQEGKASWYGPGFHGRRTASGEVYDMNQLTAAHKRLPLGSQVKVTNLSNGKSVIVRINDRGPFHGDRVIDLSKAAAKELGVLQKGTADVSITTLK
ncbi:septal ring lytic transglycosylase RlpA family protein [Suttonella ornithocola]|uniref:Endolytic peptidoglycan transglycosylase RlpA n=1 Tax=Suttonella ornithocola TaxID=279832 RepID=A0A380MT27_9GAMM|nr:septal ring lytic transglycosylase RlpA family protein [Suttonella ornithocola]SUO95452.1 RlpA-like protein precursor [Suttonella ornithocola]